MLQSLAAKHGLAGLTAFGSAVREDFRHDSDVDIALEPAPGRSLRITDLLSIREQLETILDRDVDLVNVRFANEDVARRIQEEGVSLRT
ncbi:MAG TPA: nucleotidyltransferase domain-containing protein [Coriobacteriia bacterium]|nr:nucleotidyltransferase domain-containing protein [Coriobacteriia bacterium]